MEEAVASTSVESNPVMDKMDKSMFKESEIHEYWEEKKIFEKQTNNNFDKTFTFYDGPPFMTGLPHYGHILAGLIKDTVTRHQYSKGYNVPRINGSDAHGLPIEFEIEKELGIKTTEQVLEYGIKNYNAKCREIVFSCKDRWKEIMGKLGRWIDFDNGYATLTKEFMNSVWWVFSELYKKDRIYEGLRIMPYSTSCGTPLSNFETQQNYKEVNNDSLYLKFKIISNKETCLWKDECPDDECYFIVWTTTPWTLPSNYVLAVNKNINYVALRQFNKITEKYELFIVAENLVDEMKAILKIKENSIYTIRGEKLIETKYEPLFTYNDLHNDYKVIHGDFVSDSSGTGIVHCFDPDTKIIMYDNSIKKIKDIKNGDKIWGDDNTVRNVVGLIPETSGKMYEIKQNKGTTYIVSENHILVLMASGVMPYIRKINKKYSLNWRSKCDKDNCKKNCKGFKTKSKTFETEDDAIEEKEKLLNGQNIVNDCDIYELTVLDYCNICTQDCKDRLRGYKSDYPIKNNEENYELPIPPYLLGLWLGDGSTNDVRIIGTDKEIEDYISLYCDNVGMRLSKTIIKKSQKNIIKSNKICYVWRISSNKKGEKNLFKEKLKNLGILNKKYIPDTYMNANETDRYLLLAGLIDTDGCLDVSRTLNFDFQQSNHRKNLVKQTAQLAESLGISVGKISKQEYDASRFGKKIFDDGDKLHYTFKVRFYGKNILKIPTLIPRKQAFRLSKQTKFTNIKTSFIKISKSKKNKFVGITVDKNGRFLLDDLTVVHNCAPGHGEDDYKACLENNLITKESKIFMTLDTNGFVNNSIPEIKGMFYKHYDEKDKKDKNKLDMNTWVTIKLKEKGLYLLKKTIKHNYPFCWRSDTPLIYRAISSHFVKVDDMQEKLVKLNEQINWYPKHVGEKRFASWIGNARDWGISRNRFWGTPIPIWKSEDGDEICVSSSYELEKLLNMPENSIDDLHRDSIDDYVIIIKGKEYKRISPVFDCWFESGSMPYGSLNQIGITETLKQSSKGVELDANNHPFIKTNDDKIHKILPADFIAEGIDQTRGWFYTLLILSASIFDMIPFKNVIVNGIILASDGQKMSKRLKNYPDPELVLEKYSSDCLRLYLLASPASTGESLKFNEEGVVIAMKDIIIKIKNGSLNFLREYTMLYNEKNEEKPIYNLMDYSVNKEDGKINKNYEKLKNSLSLWFVNKYKNHRNKFMNFMDNYNLRQAIEILYEVVEDLNNGFIKMGRYLLKGNDTSDNCKEGLSTLYFALKYIANDFKSIIPFFSEMLYLELEKISYLHEKIPTVQHRHESIHLCQYDEYPVLTEEQIELADNFDIIYEIIKGIHKIRSKNNKSAKKPIKSIYLLSDDLIKDKIKEEYFDYIYSECNVIDINKVDENEIHITKTLTPVKSLFFKKHGKDIKNTFENLLTKNNQELEEILLQGIVDDFEITIDEFNINYNIKFASDSEGVTNDYIKIEEVNCNNSKIFVIADILHDEDIDKLYYAKLFSTSVQKMRKNAGLHPWNQIRVYWKGTPKYDFNEAMMININKTIKMEVLLYNEEYKEKIFYQEDCVKTDLTILFENII
jgi:isoleucyl-tRNA synthetase